MNWADTCVTALLWASVTGYGISYLLLLHGGTRKSGLICFGAGWEREDHQTECILHPAINVSTTGIPSVMVLNTEYKKLDQKFQFIQAHNI